MVSRSIVGRKFVRGHTGTRDGRTLSFARGLRLLAADHTLDDEPAEPQAMDAWSRCQASIRRNRFVGLTLRHGRSPGGCGGRGGGGGFGTAGGRGGAGTAGTPLCSPKALILTSTWKLL